MRRRIQAALDEVRPKLQADGGDVELVDYRDGTAFVRFQGSCQGCPHSGRTLEQLIEKTLLQRLPRLKAVRPV